MSAQPILHQGDLRGAVVTFRDITQTRMAEGGPPPLGEARRRRPALQRPSLMRSTTRWRPSSTSSTSSATPNPLKRARTYAILAESELVRVADITMQTLQFHRHQTTATPVDLEDTTAAILRLYASRLPARNITVAQRMRTSPKVLLLEGENPPRSSTISSATPTTPLPKGGNLHLRLRPAACLKTRPRRRPF